MIHQKIIKLCVLWQVSIAKYIKLLNTVKSKSQMTVSENHDYVSNACFTVPYLQNRYNCSDLQNRNNRFISKLWSWRTLPQFVVILMGSLFILCCLSIFGNKTVKQGKRHCCNSGGLLLMVYDNDTPHYNILWTLLLTWINFSPSMDKQLQAQ